MKSEIIYLKVKVKINYEDKNKRKYAIEHAKDCVTNTSILGMQGAKPISSTLIKKS